MIEITDESTEIFDSFCAFAAAGLSHKLMMSYVASRSVDIPPLVMMMTDEEEVICQTGIPSEDSAISAAELVAELLDNIVVCDELVYYCVVTDSYARSFDTEVEATGVSGGALADDFANNPLSDVIEGLSVVTFSLTGEFVHGFIRIVLDDKGMPVPTTRSVGLGESSFGHSSHVMNAVRNFIVSNAA